MLQLLSSNLITKYIHGYTNGKGKFNRTAGTAECTPILLSCLGEIWEICHLKIWGGSLVWLRQQQFVLISNL